MTNILASGLICVAAAADPVPGPSTDDVALMVDRRGAEPGRRSDPGPAVEWFGLGERKVALGV